MYEIARERHFSASHQLREYEGSCERLHGHNWRVVVCVRGEELNSQGMLIDFHELDHLMEGIIEPFDHQHLNEVPPFETINPSSENLARVIAEGIAAKLPNPALQVAYCDVWENDRSRARFIP